MWVKREGTEAYLYATLGCAASLGLPKRVHTFFGQSEDCGGIILRGILRSKGVGLRGRL